MVHMRILIVQDTDWLRRNPYQHMHIAERLSTRGHEVRVIDYDILWRSDGRTPLISLGFTRDVSRIIQNGRVTVVRPGIIRLPMLDYVSMIFTYSREIRRQIKEFRPTVIVGNDILTTVIAFSMAKRHGIPTLFYSIDIDHKLIPYRFLQPLGKIMESWNIRNATKVAAINEALRFYTVEMGAKVGNTLVIPSGVDMSQYRPNMDGRCIRDAYGISVSDKVVLFMGWLYPFSGLDQVIASLRESPDRYSNIKIVIVGDGEAFENLERQIEQSGLSHSVIMTGLRPYSEMPEFIAASDVCILPAIKNEVMSLIVPLKIMEYMAMGKPVVATRLEGLEREFGERNGIVFVEGPARILPMAYEILVDGTAKLLGSRARSRVEGNDWDKIAAIFEAELLSLADGKKRD